MVLIIFSMTADVQAMIHNDQPSSRGRRIPMSRQDRELYQLHMQNFPKHSSRREFNYIRQLKTYIRSSITEKLQAQKDRQSSIRQPLDRGGLDGNQTWHGDT